MRFLCPALILLTACAGSVQPGTPSDNTTIGVAPQMTLDIRRDKLVKSTELAAPLDAVWKAMLAAHETIGIPLESADERAGTAVFRFKNTARQIAGRRVSAYVDCGTGSAGPRAETHRVTIKVSEQVERVTDEQTALHTVVEASARDNGLSNDAVNCLSTGVLEARVLELVAARVATH